MERPGSVNWVIRFLSNLKIYLMSHYSKQFHTILIVIWIYKFNLWPICNIPPHRTWSSLYISIFIIFFIGGQRSREEPLLEILFWNLQMSSTWNSRWRVIKWHSYFMQNNGYFYIEIRYDFRKNNWTLIQMQVHFSCLNVYVF